ncbi:MAG: hypothetical protein ACLUH5_03375 [Eubacterium sp.]
MILKAKKSVGNIIFAVGFGLMILPMILIGILMLFVEGISKLTDICLSSLERGEANV